MKKIVLAAAVVICFTGCATDGVGVAGSPQQHNATSYAPQPPKLPDLVTKMLAFGNRETAVVNACIAAQQKAGFKPMGARKELMFIQQSPAGNRSYKVTVAGLASFQVPADALAKQSPELKKMLTTFGSYVASREESSTITVSATTKSDVAFLHDVIASAAPGIAITTALKPNETANISFASNGPSVYRLQ